jgi:hypothetical protein
VMDRCCMCKRNGESVDHLLLHCDVASAIWSAFFSRFGLSWVMPRRVVDLYDCWWSSGRPRSACGVENGAYVPLLVFVEGNE